MAHRLHTIVLILAAAVAGCGSDSTGTNSGSGAKTGATTTTTTTTTTTSQPKDYTGFSGGSPACEACLDEVVNGSGTCSQEYANCEANPNCGKIVSDAKQCAGDMQCVSTQVGNAADLTYHDGEAGLRAGRYLKCTCCTTKCASACKNECASYTDGQGNGACIVQ